MYSYEKRVYASFPLVSQSTAVSSENLYLYKFVRQALQLINFFSYQNYSFYHCKVQMVLIYSVFMNIILRESFPEDLHMVNNTYLNLVPRAHVSLVLLTGKRKCSVGSGNEIAHILGYYYVSLITRSVCN